MLIYWNTEEGRVSKRERQRSVWKGYGKERGSRSVVVWGWVYGRGAEELWRQSGRLVVLPVTNSWEATRRDRKQKTKNNNAA